MKILGIVCFIVFVSKISAGDDLIDLSQIKELGDLAQTNGIDLSPLADLVLDSIVHSAKNATPEFETIIYWQQQIEKLETICSAIKNFKSNFLKFALALAMRFKELELILQEIRNCPIKVFDVICTLAKNKEALTDEANKIKTVDDLNRWIQMIIDLLMDLYKYWKGELTTPPPQLAVTTNAPQLPQTTAGVVLPAPETVTLYLDPEYCNRFTLTNCIQSPLGEPINQVPLLCRALCKCKPTLTCSNGGTPAMAANEVCTCACPIGYSGDRCQTVVDREACLPSLKPFCNQPNIQYLCPNLCRGN